MTDELDINKILGRGELRVTPEEHPDDRSVRLKAEARATLIEHCKSVVLFVVVLVVVLALGGLCVYVVFFDKTATPDAQRWAQTSLTALASGSISFLFGRAIGK